MERAHAGKAFNPRKKEVTMRMGRRLAPALALLAALCLLPVQAVASTATDGTTRHTTHAATSSAGAHKSSSQTVHHRPASSEAQFGKATSPATHKTAPASHRRKGHKAKPRRSTAYTRLAQMQMDPARVESIQQALINAGAFRGTPTGRWDSETRDAMARYQTENGFGVTGLPDAKSLMKMGLGPHPLPPELNKTPATASAGPADAAAAAPPGSPAAPPKTTANPSVAPPSRD